MKILSLPVDRGGCGWYRVRQPFDLINQYTSSEAHVLDTSANLEDTAIYTALLDADIVVVRQGGEGGRSVLTQATDTFAKAVRLGRGMKAKWVLDIDDNIEVISPYSPHYREYGTREFYDSKSKKWLYKDRVDNFQLEDNRTRVMSLMKGMMEADLVTVTTEKLGEYAKQYNKSVAVLPNAIDHQKWWKIDRMPGKKLRVGWSGGHSHYEDWHMIKQPLNHLLREYQFTLVMVGSAFVGLIDPDLRHLVEVHPWVPFEAHSYHMMALGIDIAIIPLTDLPFNHYKSPIKFLEMSAMGIPSLVSDCTPYKEVITPMGNAVTYKTSEEFIQGLEGLLSASQIRDVIGKNAKEFVKENFDGEKIAQLYIDTYKSIL